MKRQQPMITIHKFAYLVDVDREQFIDFNHSENTICFCHLRTTGRGYTLWLNKNTNKVYFGVESPMPDHVIIVKLPQITKLDPIGLSEKYQKPIAYFMHLDADKTWLDELGVNSKLKY